MKKFDKVETKIIVEQIKKINSRIALIAFELNNFSKNDVMRIIQALDLICPKKGVLTKQLFERLFKE